MFKLNRTIFIAIAPIALLFLGAEVQGQDDVDCAGCVNAVDIATGAVTTTKIRRGAVRNSDIRNNAITSNKIAPRSVGVSDIAENAVATGKIRNGAVTIEKLSPQLQQMTNGAIGGIVLEQTAVTDGSGVVSSSCPAHSLVGSAGCICEGDGDTSNFGILFACSVAGNGGVAGCFQDGSLFDPQLPPPPVTITLVCVSAVQNDGTPIEPTPLAAKPLGISKIDNSGADLQIAENTVRSAVAARNNALRNR